MKTTQIIRIDTKIYKAVKKILKEFPKETDETEFYTPSQWINWVLDWYIRHIFTNGNDYIDRD